MLGKLLKYDLKAGARRLPIVYLAIVVAYLMGLLAKLMKINQAQIGISILLVCGAVASAVMAVLFVIVHFLRNLYGAEGYLMQTLPVGKGKLILSKAISAYIWMGLSIIMTVLAILGMLQLNDVTQYNQYIDYIFGANFQPLVIYVLLAGCAQLFAFLGEIYFAITLANTRPFIKNHIGFSIVFYFVANFAVGILDLIAMAVIPLGVRMSGGAVTWTTDTMLGTLSMDLGKVNFGVAQMNPPVSDVTIGFGSVFVNIAVGIALLAAARWLMTHKTSVK